MDVFDYITMTFEEPVARFDSAAIHLRQKVDTIWTDVPFEFEHDSLDVRRYNLYYDWEPGGEYEFAVDSTAFHGIYGLFTDKIKQAFKVRQIEEYGNVFLNITGADSIAFVELLDNQDKVLRRRPVIDGRAEFYYLNPGKYGARLVNDTNGNGVWDAGDYEKGIQPEMVYYYPHIIEFKANWDATQDWNVTAVPLDKQKPDELKNRNQMKTRRKRPEIVKTQTAAAAIRRKEWICLIIALLLLSHHRAMPSVKRRTMRLSPVSTSCTNFISTGNSFGRKWDLPALLLTRRLITPSRPIGSIYWPLAVKRPTSSLRCGIR